jgi:hypothetical protein
MVCPSSKSPHMIQMVEICVILAAPNLLVLVPRDKGVVLCLFVILLSELYNCFVLDSQYDVLL